MATITGGVLRTPRGMLSWRPVAPVALEFQFLTKSAKDGYVCLGVPGNWSHLTASFPGDHTPYSTHDITVNGVHYVPKKGWVYAFDAHVAEPAKFEQWFLGRLRAGYYPFVKYWNISGRHWNRAVVKAGKPFAKSSYSGDDHLHVSAMPGSEYATTACFLADYERWRTTGKNTTVKAPTVVLGRSAPKPAVKLMDAAAAKLPAQAQGTHGVATKVIQGCLIAREVWPRNDHSARARMTGIYDAGTAAAVKAFQAKVKLPATGVVDSRTWQALSPDQTSTVIRGTDGFYAWLMQCLLLARGFNPGVIDGDAGDNTIAALKRFQVADHVRNSVVNGHGDGIGGPGTWVALITF
jgi:peptidoglycan hydrolase-like protein with peptidoglycan-binding domain